MQITEASDEIKHRQHQWLIRALQPKPAFSQRDQVGFYCLVPPDPGKTLVSRFRCSGITADDPGE